MPSPPVHYLWVGPKPIDANSGQDTVGPDLLRQKYPADDQPIFFWCLDSEVEKYQAHFAKEHPGRAEITVQGIESYAASLPPIPYRRVVKKPDPEDLDNPSKYILVESDVDLKTEFISLVDKLKARAKHFQGDKTAQIQEWITIKTTFDYFVQIANEGYIADSNVVPESYDELSLAPIKEMDTLNGFHSAFVPDGEHPLGSRPDPWLMYCQKGDPKALERFDTYVRQVHHLLDGCVDETQQPLPQDTNTMLDAIGIERSIRGMISSVFVGTAFSGSSPIEARPSFSNASDNETFDTRVKMVKRYNSTHYRREKKPLIERLLVGAWHPQEFYHFAKKQDFDPFKRFECNTVRKELFLTISSEDQRLMRLRDDNPYQLTKAERRRLIDLDVEMEEQLQQILPQPTCLVEIAKLLKKYHDLGTMMALSKDPLVVQTLLEAPDKSGCLEIYFNRQCDLVGEHLAIPKDKGEEVLCQQLTHVLSLTDSIYPPHPQRDSPDTMADVVSLLKQETNTSAHKMLELFATIGPIKDDASIEAYIETLKTWHDEAKTPPSPTHFQSPQIAPFDEGETREALKQLVETTPTYRHT